MTKTNSVVAIYDDHSQAEEAVKDLQKSGIDMEKLSIIGKDYHSEEEAMSRWKWELERRDGGPPRAILLESR